MAKRKTISKRVRFEVFKRDSFTCQYCGESAPKVVLHLDHIQPVSKDGESDVLNLITSCVDCNLGKSDRLLTDNSAIQRQKDQLDELNTRREQLEMMLDWRQGLRSIDEIEMRAAADEWSELTEGYSLNAAGTLKLKKHIKKFGLQAVLNAIQKSVNYLRTDSEGRITADSAEMAWSKVGGICKMDSLPEWKQRLYHIRNIARMRSGEDWYPQTSAEILSLFEEAYHEGDSLDQLEDLAKRGIGYRELPDVLRTWIRESQNDRKAAAKAEAEAEQERQEEELYRYTEPSYPHDVVNAWAIDEFQETGEAEHIH